MLGAGSFVPTSVTRLTIGLRAQEHIQQSQFHPLVGVDPLQTTWLERGAVRSRVALLLRSSETQPLFNDLSTIDGSCPQASACCRACESRSPSRSIVRRCARAPAIRSALSDNQPADCSACPATFGRDPDSGGLLLQGLLLLAPIRATCPRRLAIIASRLRAASIGAF